MKGYLGAIAVFVLLLSLMIIPVMARDVQRGETIYIGEPGLNINSTIPDNILGICLWNSTTGIWEDQYCIGTSKSTAGVLVDWTVPGGLIPGDWYALPLNHIDPRNNITTVNILPGDTTSTLTKVFTVRPASEMPTQIPTTVSPTQTTVPPTKPTPDYSRKISSLETQVADHEVTLAAHEATLETLMATTTIETPTEAPIVTDTVNESATIKALEDRIAAMESKSQQQDSIIDQILKFLGLK